MTMIRSDKTPLIFLLLILYGISGLVALAYEVLWMRMLSLQFGVSNFGVVITVSAFMFGLGLGSILGKRYLLHLARPLMVLALIEILVALYAVGLPSINQYWSEFLITATSDIQLSAWHSIELVAALFFMLLPATAMGLGFPLVLAAIKDTQLTVSHLYAANTLGAAFGALVPVLLLPVLGWANSLYTIALLGAITGLLFFLIAIKSPLKQSVSRNFSVKPAVLDLLSYALIGAAALMLQVAWARLYGMALLRTEYVLAIIIAIFLAGTACGSVLSQWGARRLWLNLLPVTAALAAIISLISLASVSAWAETIEYSSLINALIKQGVALAMVTVVVTFCLGAWLPLLVRGYEDPSSAGAWFYGVNAIGAGFGALLAGFVLMPTVGTPLTILIAAIILFVAGMRWCKARLFWLVSPILASTLFFLPDLPTVTELLPVAHANSQSVLSLHEDAIATTHVVETQRGQRLLLSDLQRMDASTEPTAVVAQKNQARLPLLLNPDAEKVLFLGLGTGISASAALDFDVDITAVEISKGAIESADKWFAQSNRDISNKITIINDDARRYLMRSNEYYDVIVGDLFHPDLVGRSRLLSQQQFDRVKSRLNQDGLYVQWLALNQFDLTALQIVLNTFEHSFPGAALFVDGFRLAMVGSPGVTVDAGRLLKNIKVLESNAKQTGGEGVWTWLGRYIGRIKSPAKLIEDEWRPQIEYHLPRVRYAGEINFQEVLEWLIKQRPSAELAAQHLQVNKNEAELFERAYIAADASMRSWLAQLSGDEARAQRFLQFAYRGNPKDQWISGTLADKMLASLSRVGITPKVKQASLEKILLIKPDHLLTLEALLGIAQKNNDDEAIKKYIAKLKSVSPLYQARPITNLLLNERVQQL